VTSSPTVSRTQTQTPTVVVIGAGLAGLTAAYDLHRAGWRVAVLEARERVGGRVFTVRQGFLDGQHAEAGGEFIDAGHHRLLSLAEHFGLALEQVGFGWDALNDWYAYDGWVGTATDHSLWGYDLKAAINDVWCALGELGRRVPDPAQPHCAPEAARLDQQTAADWLDGLDLPRYARLAFEGRIRAEYTVEPGRFSLLDLARNAACYYLNGHGDQKSYRIVGGNDRLPQALANALPPSAVRLNAPVNRIRVLGDRVTVMYRQGDSTKSLTADYAVLAAPLTAARHIEFDPPLPAAHHAMLHGLHYGSVTKVLVQYRRRFWNDVNWYGHVMTDLPIGCSWQATDQQAGERGILTAYTGGALAEAFCTLSEADRIAAAIESFDQLCPGSGKLVEHAWTAAWPNEPYTQGAYLAYAPGDVTAHWPTLFEPAGRLYFAGEHAAVFQGYMEGAVESGQRVAHQLSVISNQ
jgi:monoamine oxidase